MVNLMREFRKRIMTSNSVGPGIKIWRGEDMISSLPDHLLYHILSFLTTEEAVWMSVLSSRWRYLWKCVPRLHIDTGEFPNDKTCAGFIHKFLNFQSESYLRDFKLSIDQDAFESDVSLYEPCLSIVIKKPKIQSFQVETQIGNLLHDEIPLTLPACEALVCLKLHLVKLNDFESLSLPCLKIMYLEDVIFPNDLAVETLISCSPLLEDLKIGLGRYDLVAVLLICSQSLKSFTLKRAEPVYARKGEHTTVVVDTPRLEYLSLIDYQFESFKIISMSDSVKVDLDVDFELMRADALLESDNIYSFLNNFSGVRDMTISWKTFQIIYCFQYSSLLRFHYLTRLRATMFSNASLEVLPIVLECFPNLKHFTLELVKDEFPVAEVNSLSTLLPRCLVSSLEYVEMESPITEKAMELKLARYFLENSATLKKLVLRLNHESTGEKHEPGVLSQLFESPRRSSLCQFEVLPVPPNPEPWWIYVKPKRFI